MGAVYSAPCLIMKKQIERKKNLKDIGGTKVFDMELDPGNDLCLIEHETKGQEAYYKGQKMKYLDYYAELADREQKAIKGKDAGNLSVGTFAGFGRGKLNKSFKE